MLGQKEILLLLCAGHGCSMLVAQFASSRTFEMVVCDARGRVYPSSDWQGSLSALGYFSAAQLALKPRQRG